MSKSIALVGNPNCGKTTLFNRLTGANQKIGNWPGVTVEQHHGQYTDKLTGTNVGVIDLPGCYSLVTTSDMPLDEKITCEYICNAENTIYLNVLDASHLNRDLYLSLQLLELGVPVIVVLNCLDLATNAGIEIDCATLAQQLGCPVIPIIAKNGTGIKQLKHFISEYQPHNNYQAAYPDSLQTIIQAWQQYCNAGQTLRILEGDELLVDRLTAINVAQVRADLHSEVAIDLDIYIAQYRRARIKHILRGAVTKAKHNKVAFSTYVDNIVLNKIFGPFIFLGVMYLMFTCAITLGGVLQEGCEKISEAIFITGMQRVLTDFGAARWIINLMADGVGRGISTTLTFAPVLATMFLCLGVLESSGYMTRAAFIVDRLMSYIGLSGRSFVPMIVGFGCNVPAVMGARTLANQRERILTIMMTPFMSCSARLAIYAIFVAAFFPPGSAISGQNIIFSLYLIGIAVAVLTGLALRGSMDKKVESLALMEMPDYRWPMFRVLFRQVWQRLKGFLFKAGALIVILCVIINGLGNDVLASVGQYLTPLFAPIGISADNWPATVGLLTGLIAKEAVVGTLNAFYLNEAAMLNSFGGVIPAYAYLLFTLLYFPCVSVVATISKELSLKWALFSVAWSTGLAYMIAALFYQIATLNSLAWVVGLSLVLTAFFMSMRWLVQKDQARAARRKLVPTLVKVDSI